jgi:hypothetical protein
MRVLAPWLNFSPFVYYSLPHNSDWADLGRTLDSMVFFFRNEKRNVCIGPTPECDWTVDNAPDEIADMSPLLPAGRKMQLGIYFTGLYSEGRPSTGKPPTPWYEYYLARLALNMPTVGSAIAYGLQTPGPTCTDFNFLEDSFSGSNERTGASPSRPVHPCFVQTVHTVGGTQCANVYVPLLSPG